VPRIEAEGRLSGLLVVGGHWRNRDVLRERIDLHLELRSIEPVVLAVHGGCTLVHPEQQGPFKEGIKDALSAGYEVLRSGGPSEAAVIEAIASLEGNRLFNAGIGGVLDEDGKVTLDAGLMRGRDRGVGAVSAVEGVKYPIRAAGAVMERTDHVQLVGEGARRFAEKLGLDIGTPEAFLAPRRVHAWEAAKTARQQQDTDLGTVGAVALDRRGNLAAGASTGGLTNKLRGRVGDSSAAYAGFAATERVAVSATGAGEAFVRIGAAGRIHHLMELGGQPVWDAAGAVVQEAATKLGGEGGVIALDQFGHFAAPHSSPALIIGWLTESGRRVIRFH
jgi:L-asparaginase / beta-aspartyl-peptidase